MRARATAGGKGSAVSVMGRTARRAGIVVGAGLLAACTQGAVGDLDFDLRDRAGIGDTSSGAQAPANRPRPDANGLISYPTYQVAVARPGDTVAAVAGRVGIPAAELARHNGLRTDEALNDGAVLAMPRRVGGGGTDIASIAGAAIDRAGGAPATVQGGQEPVRHQVARGETAFSIARLYGVSPASLAEWNGLGSDLSVREGQFLLIPLVIAGDGTRAIATPVSNLDRPVPPSASSALPETVQSQTLPPSPQLDRLRTEASAAPAPVATPAPAAPAPAAAPTGLRSPVAGEIIRPFSGSNEGVDIRAAEGTAVGAAASGTVAAITRDTDQVPILVLRHPDGLLTVYANIRDITVAKGDAVSAGQRVASVGGGNPSFLHFEVRRGFEAVDPEPLIR